MYVPESAAVMALRPRSSSTVHADVERVCVEHLGAERVRQENREAAHRTRRVRVHLEEELERPFVEGRQSTVAPAYMAVANRAPPVPARATSDKSIRASGAGRW